jgi:hypothetical protein
MNVNVTNNTVTALEDRNLDDVDHSLGWRRDVDS